MPGYAWDMDMIVVSDRSIEGYKYCIVLRCRSTGYIVALPLKLKSDAWAAVAEWIRTVRKNPLYDRYSYDLVKHIKTDLDGAWSPENEEWQTQIVKKLGVEMEYISPDRHEQAGRAERAVGIVEPNTLELMAGEGKLPLRGKTSLGDGKQPTPHDNTETLHTPSQPTVTPTLRTNESTLAPKPTSVGEQDTLHNIPLGLQGKGAEASRETCQSPSPVVREEVASTLRGSVPVVDCDGKQLTLDEMTGRLTYGKDVPEVPPPSDTDVAAWDHSMMPSVEIDVDEHIFDQAELAQAQREIVTSEEGDRWSDIFKRFKPPLNPDLIDLYREWLVEHSPDASDWTYEKFPVGRGEYLEAGLRFIPPAGRNWKAMMEERAATMRGTTNRELKRLMRMPIARVVSWIRSLRNVPAYRTAKRREKTISEGMKAIPRSLKAALQGPDALGWKEAADLEYNTLTEMGVFDHGYTLQEVRELGITKDPIGISIALDNKYIDGEFERHKVRMAVAGHKYNLTKGIDYDEVFAAAPNQNTSRVLQALTVQLGLHRKAWDIKLAYCWAELPESQMVALKYPQGYEQFRDHGNGKREPEYIVLRKNCYGLPAAGKHWAARTPLQRRRHQYTDVYHICSGAYDTWGYW